MIEPEPEAPQELVADKYRLTRLLGRGGMGSVWEGVHTSLGTRVAIKFIESEYVDSPEARNRFENEARAAATLRSKHVVQVYDHGVMPDGRPYIVMEFLSGEPLDQRLDRIGRLSPTDTALILNQVCRALAKAHQAGIVHRDLKPENVFLVWDDDDKADIAKVVDFGIAKFTNASLGVSSVTRTGSVLGTPYFMSPEQARGLRTVDFRSDLWAVGVIAFRCIVGRLPFEGEAVGDLLVKICTAPLPIPSQHFGGLPPAFDAWFTRALARDPAARFASATELAEQLCAAVGMPIRGEMPSWMVQLPPGAPGAPPMPATAPTQTPGTGPDAAYHTPGTGGHPTYQTPGYGAPPTAPSPAALTGAPITHTADAPTRSTPVGALVGVGAVALLIVGIGVVALVKFVGGSGEKSAAASPTDSQPSAAEGAPSAQGPAAERQPSVVPAPPPADEVDKKAAQDAGAPSKPAAAKPAPAGPKAPRPAARPRPVAKPAKPPPPKPPARKPKPKPIDIGY